MPRNVRNFWINCDIDGRSNRLSGGPRSKDGGFTMTIRQRDDGSVTKAITVNGYTFKDGTIKLEIGLPDGTFYHHKTNR